LAQVLAQTIHSGPRRPASLPGTQLRSPAPMSPSLHVAGLCAALLAAASHLSGCAVESSSPGSLEGETTASTTGAVPGTTGTFLGTTVEGETTTVPDTIGAFLGTTVEAETTIVPDTTGTFPGAGHEECEDDDAALADLVDLLNLTEHFLSAFGFYVDDCWDAAVTGGCSDEEVAQICCATCNTSVAPGTTDTFPGTGDEGCEDNDTALLELIDFYNIAEVIEEEFGFYVTGCEDAVFLGWCGEEEIVPLCCATCEAYSHGAGEPCSSHSCGAGEFCFEGHCATCDECHNCSDGVDGTCGSCGDGFPTLEDGPCTTATTEQPGGI